MRDRASSGSPYEPLYGFSRAVRVGNSVFVAGTAPIPEPGSALASTPYEQMLRCGDIVTAALHQLGAAVSDVVRTRMFISSPEVADEVGRAHHEVFGSAAPAATMVVASLLEPEWFVEIEVDAMIEQDTDSA